MGDNNNTFEMEMPCCFQKKNKKNVNYEKKQTFSTILNKFAYFFSNFPELVDTDRNEYLDFK